MNGWSNIRKRVGTEGGTIKKTLPNGNKNDTPLPFMMT